MNTPPVPDRPRLPWDPPDHFEKRIPDGDNRERLVCARCEFIHYQNPKIVAGAVCTWGDKILLAKRAIEPRKGFWTVPAGYMELGETTEQAAEREAREEACASIEIERLLAMYSVARIGQVQIMYRARLLSADVAAGVESEEVALVEWADIPWEQLAFPTVVWALAHFHDSRGQDGFSDLLQSHGRSRPHVAAAQAGGSAKRPRGRQPPRPAFSRQLVRVHLAFVAGFMGFCYHRTNVR